MSEHQFLLWRTHSTIPIGHQGHIPHYMNTPALTFKNICYTITINPGYLQNSKTSKRLLQILKLTYNTKLYISLNWPGEAVHKDDRTTITFIYYSLLCAVCLPYLAPLLPSSFTWLSFTAVIQGTYIPAAVDIFLSWLPNFITLPSKLCSGEWAAIPVLYCWAKFQIYAQDLLILFAVVVIISIHIISLFCIIHTFI
jgi:hypothetical protein